MCPGQYDVADGCDLLCLHEGLDSAGGHDAGQRPAREGHGKVVGAGGDQQPSRAQHASPVLRVVDRYAQAVGLGVVAQHADRRPAELRRQPAVRLEAADEVGGPAVAGGGVQGASREILGWLAENLAACSLLLVDDDDGQAVIGCRSAADMPAGPAPTIARSNITASRRSRWSGLRGPG